MRLSLTVGRIVLLDVTILGIDEPARDETPPQLDGGVGTVIDPVDDDGPSLGFTGHPRRR